MTTSKLKKKIFLTTNPISHGGPMIDYSTTKPQKKVNIELMT
jgi:hypothetical protein